MNEREIIVLADCHLRGPDDQQQPLLVDFLRRHRPKRLVLLGDIFEFLAGRNTAAEVAYRPVLQALADFEELDYLEGNHDFDLSRSIFGLYRARIHPGAAILTLHDRFVLALHGDRASPRDAGTVLLRAALQSTPVRFLRDRVLPPDWLFSFALRFAEISRRRRWPGREEEEHWSREKALHLGQRLGVKLVLFGHSHQPLLERCGAIVLANPGRSVASGSYLQIAGGAVSLRSFPDGKLLAGPQTFI